MKKITLAIALCFALVSVSAFAGHDATISNLETVRDSYKIPPIEIIIQLDGLYAKQIDLIAAAISPNGKEK